MSSESTLAKFYEASEVQNPRLPCPFCGSSYVHPGALKAHLLKKHQLQTQEYQPKEKALSEELICGTCKRCFLKNKNLNFHQKRYGGRCRPQAEKKFFCEFCSCSYTQRKSLNIHLDKVHGAQKVFSEIGKMRKESIRMKEKLCCNLCNRNYFNKDSFRRHQKIYHKLGKVPVNVQISPLTSKLNDENVELNEFVADLSVYMENLRKVTIPHLPSTSISSPSVKLQAKKQGFRIIDILKAD
ncbi:hypothetical protein B9Z55_027416 [Caenorhabditis nigoni]|uniref:C2H2-type domain-containing protein n=1 Tax=Caenorhabditis nigoni TaxID=1611254 RepID=A0A2G5SFI2_9PELO|nr:hypothetical protein B9Z55_027416 [Caenorhabditis nigoni]